MNICVKTLGCKVNNYESEYMISVLKKEGFHFVDENADVYIINTCTVTNNSDSKSKKLIRSIRKNRPNSILVVVGCFCQNKKDTILEEIDADIILGNKDKSKIVDYINEFIQTRKKIVKFYDMNLVEFEDMEISEYSSKTRAFVKIEDGCNNYCSYCIIPYVRGNVRSKSYIKVIEEIKSLVLYGHKEIVLTGIHTGAYCDKESNIDFVNLLELILEINGLERLRISSIEITELNDRFVELLKNNKILVSHLHIPLQSGSEAILKSMHRKYNKSEFEFIINKIRSVRSDISITTDVIVGFPGETEEMFLESLEFCRYMNFSKIHVFPYSDRTGTVASRMENKVNGNIKKERVKKLICLSEELEKNYANKFVGKKVQVLFEEQKDNYFIGHAGNYIKVKVLGKYKLHEIYEITLNEEDIVYSDVN